MDRRTKPSRGHHFVPAFLLANFTAQLSKDGDLWVLDKENLKKPIRKSKPINEAKERDLYRIDGKVPDPFAIEGIFSKLESEIAVIVNRVITEGKLPVGEDMGTLLYFVALLRTRTKDFRIQLSQVQNQARKQIYRCIFSDPDEWKKTKARMTKRVSSFESMTQEEFLTKLQKDIRFQPSQDWYLKRSLELSWSILETLVHRHWCLIKCGKHDDFLCSDAPVCLLWSSPKYTELPIGFGLKKTEVILPISRKFGLLGTFENIPRELELGRETVQRLNRMFNFFANRCTYGANKKDLEPYIS